MLDGPECAQLSVGKSGRDGLKKKEKKKKYKQRWKKRKKKSSF